MMPIYPYEGRYPTIGQGCYVAPNATIIGDVTLHDGVSIWFGAVLRGDVSPIIIGARTNIQDGTIIHGEDNCPTTIGEDVTVGHAAIIHAATVGDRVLVGMGAVLLSRCVIGEDSIIGARALVTEGKKLPANTLALGQPAEPRRTLTPEEHERIILSSRRYLELAGRYRNNEIEA